MKNKYGTAVAVWKVDLIEKRARAKGFRGDEIQEAQQELILAVMDFKYDPNNSNGATERTVLKTLIDNRLNSMLRRRSCRQKHLDNYKRRCESDERLDLSQVDHEAQTELNEAVQVTVAQLPEQQRKICALLAAGVPPYLVAKQLKCSRYELDNLMAVLRVRFEHIVPVAQNRSQEL